MNHPDRIEQPYPPKPGRKLAPAGWTIVYAIAAFMSGALIYIASR